MSGSHDSPCFEPGCPCCSGWRGLDDHRLELIAELQRIGDKLSDQARALLDHYPAALHEGEGEQYDRMMHRLELQSAVGDWLEARKHG